jgi:hypothetical protein
VLDLSLTDFDPSQTWGVQCNRQSGCRISSVPLTNRREIDYPATPPSLAVTECSSIN